MASPGLLERPDVVSEADQQAARAEFYTPAGGPDPEFPAAEAAASQQAAHAPQPPSETAQTAANESTATPRHAKQRGFLGNLALTASIKTSMYLHNGIGRVFDGAGRAINKLPKKARPVAVLTLGLVGYVAYTKITGHAGGVEHHLVSSSDTFSGGGKAHNLHYDLMSNNSPSTSTSTARETVTSTAPVTSKHPVATETTTSTMTANPTPKKSPTSTATIFRRPSPTNTVPQPNHAVTNPAPQPGGNRTVGRVRVMDANDAHLQYAGHQPGVPRNDIHALHFEHTRNGDIVIRAEDLVPGGTTINGHNITDAQIHDLHAVITLNVNGHEKDIIAPMNGKHIVISHQLTQELKSGNFDTVRAVVPGRNPNNWTSISTVVGNGHDYTTAHFNHAANEFGTLVQHNARHHQVTKEIIVTPHGTESRTVVVGDHGVKIIDGGQNLLVGEPGNVLTPEGYHSFLVHTADGITFHNGHMFLDQAERANFNNALKTHGLYATYEHDGNWNISQIDIHSLKSGDPTDLQLPPGYIVNFSHLNHNLSITLPDGKVAIVHVPDSAYSDGQIDFTEVQPLIKSALAKDGVDITFHGHAATLENANAAAIPSPSVSTERNDEHERGGGDDWWIPALIGGLALGTLLGIGIGSRRRRDDRRVTETRTVNDGDDEIIEEADDRPPRPFTREWFRERTRGFRRVSPTPSPEDADLRDDEIIDEPDEHVEVDQALINQAREALEEPHPGSNAANFLHHTRSNGFLDELHNRAGTQESERVIFSFVHSLSERGVVTEEPDVLHSQLPRMGIHLGRARFYYTDEAGLQIEDDDKGASIRRIANQLANNFNPNEI